MGAKSGHNVGPLLEINAAFVSADPICSIRHGRDNRLLVWQLGPADEHLMENDLPLNASAVSPKSPWLLHALPVNALNFCAFAMCFDGMPQGKSSSKVFSDVNMPRPILFAVPNAVDAGGVCAEAVVLCHSADRCVSD